MVIDGAAYGTEGKHGEKLVPRTTAYTKLPWRDRSRHFTWAWYTFTMSTGGMSLLLASNYHRFHGLTAIGLVFYFVDLAAFCLITALLVSRFIKFPGTLTNSFTHPTESLFIPSFFISLTSIFIGAQEYGMPHVGKWLLTAIRVLFWMYTASAFLVTVLQYFYLFTAQKLTLQSMTPAWILPVFPLMLSGVFASAIASLQPTHHAIPIIISGLTFQTLGFFVAIFMYSNYISRLMAFGLPNPSTRPGMFISVGPPSFTGLAYIGLADSAILHFPEHFLNAAPDVPTAQVLFIVATFFAVALWALALFFFCISALAVSMTLHRTHFHLVWWGTVFPNIGFILVTISIGRAIESQAILWVTSVATILLCIVYFVVFIAQVRAVWRYEILWPGQDEDHDF